MCQANSLRYFKNYFSQWNYKLLQRMFAVEQCEGYFSHVSIFLKVKRRILDL